MEKKIAATFRGQKAKVGHLTVNRLLPNRYVDAVGPFVFLDHLLPTVQEPKKPEAPNGDFAHPHRGFATFSYIFSGELEHFDSRGNHGVVSAGGAQWMKAGNGIIHDENPTQQFQQKGGLLHGLQFWINLPAKNKTEDPEYLAVQAADIPEIDLHNGAGKLRVIIGEYGNKTSPVKTFTKQFIYHVKLNAYAAFTLPTVKSLEYAAYIPTDDVHVNNSLHGRGEFIEFGHEEAGDILLTNKTGKAADIILFGGEPYTEPIVAEGPFVMNSDLEIAAAYRDYFNGKYGKIEYDRVGVGV